MDRFWDKVEPEPSSGCWLWAAYLNPRGYGEFGINNKTHRAHRVAWELSFGPIPSGAHVLHKCDMPSCVNADHLFLGTQADNMADMCRKGRSASGERSGQAKLTLEQVAEIRTSSETQQFLADRLGVTQATVSLIKSGKRWTQAGRK